jgi:AcrR family transcriptional regulator
MPRITGPDIATHVAQQEAAVVRAAVDLFAERGFAAVTLADIAAAVGLKRTSLYRYFPDKDHILLAWLRTEIADLIDRSEAVAASGAPPEQRLVDWIHLQLDYLEEPEHQLFASIAASIGTLSPEVREAVVADHRRLYDTVDVIVAAGLGGGTRDPAVVATLVIGLFRAASDAIARGGSRDVIGPELDRSAIALLRA